MVYHEIEPTFSEEESGGAPPPPPEYAFIGVETFTDDILAELKFNERELNEQNGEIEHTLSLHEFKKDLYQDEFDSSIHSVVSIDIERDELDSKLERERRRLVDKKIRGFMCLCSALLFLIVLALGLTALSMNKSVARNDLIISSSSELIVNVTDAPTITTATPTAAPTATPTVCVDEIIVPKDCYTFGESIQLDYHYCTPEGKNWLGVYREGSAGDDGTMLQRSMYWELTCGGHGDSCETPMEFGNVTMTPRLGVGRYQIYGMGNMDRPYVSKAASQSFMVRRSCDEAFNGDNSVLPSHR